MTIMPLTIWLNYYAGTKLAGGYTLAERVGAAMLRTPIFILKKMGLINKYIEKKKWNM